MDLDVTDEASFSGVLASQLPQLSAALSLPVWGRNDWVEFCVAARFLRISFLQS